MTVYTVFTGGTISCSAKGGVLSPDNKNGYLLLDLAKQAGVKAAFVTAQPYTILSENLGAAHLQALRKCLQAAIDIGYDRIRGAATQCLQRKRAGAAEEIKHIGVDHPSTEYVENRAPQLV